MPHIAPISWLMICLFSLFSIFMISSAYSWWYQPVFPVFKGKKVDSHLWSWL
nr:ATPase F0 subunit 8 [Armandia sp. GK-2021]